MGEHIGTRAATWYLSLLLSKDGDELSVTVNIQEVTPAITELTADVSLDQRLLFEQTVPEDLNSADSRSAISAAPPFLMSFFQTALEHTIAGMAELERNNGE